MRVAGYLRESFDQEGEASFAQSERIRRWATEGGHRLVAVCQDLRTPGRELGRDGLRAILALVDDHAVDGVVVSSLGIFSTDTVHQEVIIADLRHRDVAVFTADEAERPLLEDPSPDQLRMVTRDVLAKVARHRHHTTDPSTRQQPEVPHPAVVVELIPAERHRGTATSTAR